MKQTAAFAARRLSAARQVYIETRNRGMSKNRSTETIVGMWVATGTALGAALGAAFGDVAIGVAFGVTFGAAIGATMSRRSKDDIHEDDA